MKFFALLLLVFPILEAQAISSRFKRSRLTSDEAEMRADRRSLLLAAGEDKSVDISFKVAGANGIAVANSKVVATSVVTLSNEKQQIVFRPLSTGDTTVTLRDPNGTIRLIVNVKVTGNNMLRIAGELRDLLKEIEGIDIRVLGRKIIIDGELIIPQDYGRLEAVVSGKGSPYSDFVLNLSTLSPLALQVVSKRIEADLKTFAPTVTARVVNGMIFLEGEVDNIDVARRAEEMANLYLPEYRPPTQLEKLSEIGGVLKLGKNRPPIKNLIIFRPPPSKKVEKLVRVTIHFVELNKNYSRLLGFKWQPTFVAATDGTPTLQLGGAVSAAEQGRGFSLSATLSNLLPKLQSAQSAGFARVLKTGTILTRSGEAANIRETIDYPFLIQGQAGSVTGSSAPVGFQVNVTPEIVGSTDDIEMNLDLTQSSVVGRVRDGRAPTVSNHSVKTNIFVKSLDSAAVAGVTASDVGTDFNKDDPDSGAAEGDPLFTLLRSKNYRKQKSQFVVFVTPEIVENASQGSADLKKNFRIRVR